MTIRKEEEEESRSKDTREVCAGSMGTWLYIHLSISKQQGSKDVLFRDRPSCPPLPLQEEMSTIR